MSDFRNPSLPSLSLAKDDRLKGRRVVITGGASGIGLATAELFAAKGAKVSVLDLAVEPSSQLCADSGGLSLKTDIADSAAVEAALKQAAEAMGGLDGVVASAGISGHIRIEETDDEYWNKILAVNLNGIFYTCRAALPHLRECAGATIVLLASSVALVPTSPGTAYAASKGGILAFNKTLALECAPAIRVNTVCPGMTDTPMNGPGKFKDKDGKWPDWVKTRYLMQRVGEPLEVAYAALYLTSHESSYVTINDRGRRRAHFLLSFKPTRRSDASTE